MQSHYLTTLPTPAAAAGDDDRQYQHRHSPISNLTKLNEAEVRTTMTLMMKSSCRCSSYCPLVENEIHEGRILLDRIPLDLWRWRQTNKDGFSLSSMSMACATIGASMSTACATIGVCGQSQEVLEDDSPKNNAPDYSFSPTNMKTNKKPSVCLSGTPSSKQRPTKIRPNASTPIRSFQPVLNNEAIYHEQ